MLDFEIYAPIVVPISWQSELLTDNDQRYSLLKMHLAGINGIDIQPNDWPMGYGSLEHDNIPVFYQPSAVIGLHAFNAEHDVSHAKLYVYDNCLAVLHIGLAVNVDLANINDLMITKRVETLSQKLIAPILKLIYLSKPESPLINPIAYKFFDRDEEELTNAKPIWVARMLTQSKKFTSEQYHSWLKNIDSQSELLKLGSGNSLLTNEQLFPDVHRIMVMSQFHAALMERVENLLKCNLKKFNSDYYKKGLTSSLDNSFKNQQYRNDHIDYINIQVSAAAAGVQGRRSELLKLFDVAWNFSAQRERIEQLTKMTQVRLDRILQSKLRKQNRNIQTLLAFLGSLSLISLIIDLISVESDVSHDDTSGLLDLIQLFSAEHLLGLTVMTVILFTLYFYKNHE